MPGLTKNFKQHILKSRRLTAQSIQRGVRYLLVLTNMLRTLDANHVSYSPTRAQFVMITGLLNIDLLGWQDGYLVGETTNVNYEQEVAGNESSARLPIPAGILRIPVFFAPVALFSQESQFLFRRDFFGTSSGNLSVWGHRRKLHRTSICLTKTEYDTILWYSTMASVHHHCCAPSTIAALPLLRCHHHCHIHCCAAIAIAIAALPKPLLRCLSCRCTAIAVAALPKPLLHRYCRCCAAIAIAAPPPSLPLLRPSLRRHCCATMTETGDDDNGDEDGNNDR